MRRFTPKHVFWAGAPWRKLVIFYASVMIEYDMAIYGWDEYHHQTLGSSALLQSCFPLSSIWSAIVSIVFIDSIHMYPWILPDQDDESLVLPPVRSLPGVLGGNSGVSPAQWESSVISADGFYVNFIRFHHLVFHHFSIGIFDCHLLMSFIVTKVDHCLAPCVNTGRKTLRLIHFRSQSFDIF